MVTSSAVSSWIMPSTALFHQRGMCFCYCDVLVNTSHIMNLLVDTDGVNLFNQCFGLIEV